MTEKVEKQCTALLLNSKCNTLPFHNIERTKEVVSNVKVICNYLKAIIKNKYNC